MSLGLVTKDIYLEAPLFLELERSKRMSRRAGEGYGVPSGQGMYPDIR